jgi:hypothetical protein
MFDNSNTLMVHTLESQNHTKCLIEHNTLIVNGLLITNTYQNKLGQVCTLKVVLNITFLTIVNLENNKNKLIFCKVHNDRGIDLMDAS